MRRYLATLALVLCAACSGETGDTDTTGNNGKSDGTATTCSLADSDARQVIEFQRDGETVKQCQGPGGQFVENVCCPDLIENPFTDDELECLCFEQDFNDCLLAAETVDDAIECQKIPDDTLLDENCCEQFPGLVSKLCEEFAEEGDPSIQTDALQCGGDGDLDDDGVGDEVDNCPSVANADQADADNDGRGDVCDSTPDGELASCLCFEKSFNDCLVAAGDDFGAIEECIKSPDDTLEDEECCAAFPDDLSVLCTPLDSVEGDPALAAEQADLVCN